MSHTTLATQVVCVQTNSRFAIEYPAYPASCDRITLHCKKSGLALDVMAKGFEKDAASALDSVRQFLAHGLADDLGDCGDEPLLLAIDGIPDYRVAITKEDVQFVTKKEGEWFETAYWHVDEFADDAESVLGAICGALSSVDPIDEDGEAVSGVA